MKKLLFIGCWTLIFTLLISGGAKGDTFVDSLRREIEVLPDSSKLIRLNELLFANTHDKVYKVYADLLLEEAERQHDDFYRANALMFLMRYYYAKDPDSLRVYLKIAEPLFIAANRIEELCRVKGWNIYSLVNEGMRDLVIPEVDSLRNLAIRFNYPDGVDMANQALASYYFSIGLVKEGIRLSREVLSDMEERNVPTMRWYYVLRLLLTRDLNPEYLHKLDSCIQSCERKGITQLDAEHTIAFLKERYHFFSAQYYVKKKDATLAYPHLLKMEDIKKKNNLNAEQLQPKFVWMNYYTLVGKYEEALDLANRLGQELSDKKRIRDWIIVETLKADIYYKLGRGMESATAYKDAKRVNDSIMQVKYYEDLAMLRTQRDMEKLEVQKEKLELEAERSHVRLIKLGGGLLLVALLCVGLGIIAYTRHRTGIRLRIAKEKAEEADHLKSAFLANMNHEIRTPLNAIVGFSQVIADEEDAETRHELSNIIQSNNELLQRLIEDVLDISKIESNMLTFVLANHEMKDLMKDIYSIILLRMPENVELRLADCQPFTLYTDRGRLTQVLTNLLTNAIKHTKKGYICFGYDVTAKEIRFYVTDTGEGIPSDQLERVFDRFVKLTEWTKGVGLGLAISKGLVTKLGGRIEVTSTQGVGSTFSVIFPR
ncbi:sensor histidine kinase KdpD [Parabacteroides sp. ZJ-118]|uniref:sensor histidine kinase n=1 Tax=Parabacteroides sp. ZJ-118 TaxID=2709398 RepID=UPI0013EBB066|nr:HAMP domain-containing sensor histidine kinase [Parabacteroides sp. ZJ-118]